jgi:Uma2 family endonuclease
MSTVTRGTEQRVVLNDVSWDTFLALSKEATGGRLAYDRGQLEITSPSYEHENVKGFIRRLVEVYTEELEIDISSAGSTTLSREDLDRGIEPDECYYVAGADQVRGKDNIDLPVDPPPDLAIEVDISRSSVNKLSICAAMGIPEVWRYDGSAVEINILRDDAVYERSTTSTVFPQFPFNELNRLLLERGVQSETQIARGFRQWIRENLQA